MGAGVLSRLPEGPPETLLSLEQCQAFLQEDFDLGRFEAVALSDDGGTKQVTLSQLIHEINLINSISGSDKREEKFGSRHGTGEEKTGTGSGSSPPHTGRPTTAGSDARSGSRPGTEGGSSRPETGNSALGADPRSKKGRRARRRAREREEKGFEPEMPVMLTKKASLYVEELTEKLNLLRVMKRLRYARALIEENKAKAVQAEKDRLQREEDEIEANKEEEAANAYIAKLSAKRKELGWGNWDKMKRGEGEEEDEEEEEEAPKEEDAPEVAESNEEEKAALAALLQKEEEELAELQEAIKDLRDKIDSELKGEMYRPPPEDEARFFLREHYKALSPPTRIVEHICANYAPQSCTLSLDPDRNDFQGREDCVAALVKAFGQCRLTFVVLKVEMARKPKKGFDLSFTVVLHLSLDGDAPRAVMETYDLKKSKEDGISEMFVIGRHSVLTRDTRPLYTYAVKPPARTKYDNLEPHIRASFPPSEAELLERAAGALVADREAMVFFDEESKALEKYRQDQAAKLAKEAADKAEKERLAALFKDEEEDEEEEEEEEGGGGEAPEADA